jgi:two-component system chemotaxis response regulator CheB
LPAALVVVQHMPAGFTRSLAERLDTLSRLRVKEASPGDTPAVGQALVAPGGFHMLFDENKRVTLNQNPAVHGVRPAVDVTLASLVQRYGKAVIAVILTGMGSDGTNGAALLHGAGGQVLVEDESSSVVWGMPRSVVEAGCADAVLPLSGMAAAIERAVRTYPARVVEK